MVSKTHKKIESKKCFSFAQSHVIAIKEENEMGINNATSDFKDLL